MSETADLISRIAPAVDYANSRGVSHRDLKPANIVFDRGGEPRVADFGIARISESKTALTQGVIGTPAYMSPEQWEGIALDGRSDVYSLGVMAFEMLTGQTPYVAETITGFMKAHLMNEVPDSRERVPDLPVAAQYTLAHALAKDRAQRYETAFEFARDLVAAAKAQPLHAATIAAAASARAARSAADLSQNANATRVMVGPTCPHGPSMPRPPELRPAGATSDSIVPPPAPRRHGSPLALGGILAGVIVLGAIVAFSAVLSLPAATPPALTRALTSTRQSDGIVAIETPTRLLTSALTLTPTPGPTRFATPTVAPTAEAPRPSPTPYPVFAPRVIQSCAGAPPTAGVFVARGGCWRYYDSASDLGSAWKEPDFDDRSWSVGPAQLGYGDEPTTTLGFGPDPSNKLVTAYFRHVFSVATIEGISIIRMMVWRDDGVVIYLNGLEVARDNMPGGVITRSTFAVANIVLDEEFQPVEFILPVARMMTGINVLAAEVHQDRPDSSDMRFSLELSVLPPGVPTSTPRPTRTPTPSPTACVQANPFGVPSEKLAGLGCSVGIPIGVSFIIQEFERGYMIVNDRSDPANPGGGNIYAIVNGGAGYRDQDTFKKTSDNPDLWYSCNPTAGLKPEQSGVPWRGFGLLWCKSADIRAALGGVKLGSPERFVTGAAFQSYEVGRAMRLEDRTIVFTSPDSGQPGLVAGRWR